MDREQLRTVIYNEIMDFHQPRTPTLSFCLRPAPKLDGMGDSLISPDSSSALSFKDQLQTLLNSMPQVKSDIKKDDKQLHDLQGWIIAILGIDLVCSELY